jgi:hypothetical protein
MITSPALIIEGSVRSCQGKVERMTRKMVKKKQQLKQGGKHGVFFFVQVCNLFHYV